MPPSAAKAGGQAQRPRGLDGRWMMIRTRDTNARQGERDVCAATRARAAKRLRGEGTYDKEIGVHHTTSSLRPRPHRRGSPSSRRIAGGCGRAERRGAGPILPEGAFPASVRDTFVLLVVDLIWHVRPASSRILCEANAGAFFAQFWLEDLRPRPAHPCVAPVFPAPSPVP